MLKLKLKRPRTLFPVLCPFYSRVSIHTDINIGGQSLHMYIQNWLVLGFWGGGGVKILVPVQASARRRERKGENSFLNKVKGFDE